ncbi:MAG: outer membrane lipoprotein-sorting protein, partial [Nitrospira sp.]|nr:outer membrane lipoprotein-sorting protein [Nitrospira sp.]
MQPKMRHMYIALFLLFPLFVFNAASETLPAGEEIARRVNARDEGEVVSRFVTMAMTDRSGTERVRETKSFRKYFGKEKRTVIFYLSPANIKDTAFLTYDYPEVDRDDDQWLYLPAVRKVRRISASDRGDYFLGTDFTYEDIRKETKVGIEDYSWKTLAEETIDGHRCFLVEEIPVNEKTAKELGYSKVQSWVDAEIWMVRQAKYWDVAGNPLKTLQVREIT